MHQIRSFGNGAHPANTNKMRINVKHTAYWTAFLASSLMGLSTASAETNISFGNMTLPASGALAVGVYEGGTLSPSAQTLNAKTGGLIRKAIDDATFKGTPYTTLELFAPQGLGLKRIYLLGLGKEGARSSVKLRDIGGYLANEAIKDDIKELSIALDLGSISSSSHDAAALIAFGARLGSYRFDKYFAEGIGSKNSLERVNVLSNAPQKAQMAFSTRYEGLATAVNGARNLISEPANVIWPETFVKRAKGWFKGVDNVKIDVIDEKQMKKLGMGALYGVGKGSSRPPRLLVVRYNGASSGDAPIAFVGKGITFDSGGISIKKSSGMWKMKYDMSGASAAISTVRALALRGANVNAIGIAALAENMPSATAQRPGDVIKTMSGKTIEIMSTDAEGRLVLADAVWYAQEKFHPKLLVDVATLTGSVRTALGDEYAGLFSNDTTVIRQMLEAGIKSGEEVWNLPLHPSYQKDIASPIADIRNGGSSGMAGAGIGAEVIHTFIQPGTKWAHLDIAGMAWEVGGQPTVPLGAAGYAVQLLDKLVELHYESE